MKTLTITPDVAIQILDNTKRQRSVNNQHVKWLSSQMRNGSWRVNGETIILTKDIDGGVVSPACEVLDGQHRLWACVESGVAFETFVVTNMSIDVFDTIDTGRARSSKNVLDIELHGSKTPNAVKSSASSAIRHILSFDAKTGRYNTSHRKNLTNSDIKEFVRRDPSIMNIVEALYETGKSVVPNSILAAVAYVVRGGYPNALEDFMIPVQTGVNIDQEEPAYVLREKVLSDKSNRHYRNDRTMLAMVIKAWNAHSTGSRITYLRYAPPNESFPTLHLRPEQRRYVYKKAGGLGRRRP